MYEITQACIRHASCEEAAWDHQSLCLGSGEPAVPSLKKKQKEKHTQKQQQQQQKAAPKRKQSTCRRLAKKQRQSFTTYFPRVLKKIHEDLSLSQEALSVLDSFVKVMFERIVQEASHLVRSNQRATLTSREIQTAVRLLLPGDIGKHAVNVATKAVIRYTSCA
ncbi:PREDICTED: histone H2B-like [Condylura cristata]|uniref:histone H2B-like n=1 Tax=Condylura cristata TaxID=143302 RepID=UPI0003347B66|nr:PREDICTED: histone H2B-like [Condylura cristata]